MGPVAGSLALGLILGLCPGGGRGAPLAGSWPKDARSRRPDQGTGRAVRQGEGVAALAGIMAGACRMDQGGEF